MAPKLYIFHGSPPCRAVIITAKALGISLTIYAINSEKKELFSPEYLKINPQHKVPALDDDGNIICDSHAINTYLVAKYAKDDLLYPRELYQRAKVDEKLYFDAAVLFNHFHSIIALIMSKQAISAPAERVKYTKESYGVLEKYLEGHLWVTGDNVTIADFSLVTTITGLEVLVAVDPKTFPNITAWVKRCEALPWFIGDDKEKEGFLIFYRSLFS